MALGVYAANGCGRGQKLRLLEVVKVWKKTLGNKGRGREGEKSGQTRVSLDHINEPCWG